MTDRYFALTVVLAKDIRDDEAQPIIDAIQQLRGVLSVNPHVSNIETHMAEERARHDLRLKIWDVLK